MPLNTDFPIGSRVIVTRPQEVIPRNATGTVKGYEPNTPSWVYIETDKQYPDLHDCEGIVPSGKGYGIMVYKLKKIKP